MWEARAGAHYLHRGGGKEGRKERGGGGKGGGGGRGGSGEGEEWGGAKGKERVQCRREGAGQTLFISKALQVLQGCFCELQHNQRHTPSEKKHRADMLFVFR